MAPLSHCDRLRASRTAVPRGLAAVAVRHRLHGRAGSDACDGGACGDRLMPEREQRPLPPATLRDPATTSGRARSTDARSRSPSGTVLCVVPGHGAPPDHRKRELRRRASRRVPGRAALVARRSVWSRSSILLYDLATGTTTTVWGAIDGRTATVRLRSRAWVGRRPARSAEPQACCRGRAGRQAEDGDRGTVRVAFGPTIRFCLRDVAPRTPMWGPCTGRAGFS